MQHFRSFCNLVIQALGTVSPAKAAITALIPALLISTSATSAEYTRQMQLMANGQVLTLLLKPNSVTAATQVIDQSGSEIPMPVNTFTGMIKGDPDSWVRLTQSRNAIDGVISRFGKRFRLQQTGDQPANIKPLADKHDRRVTITANGNINRTVLNRTNTTITRVARIAIVVDSKFNAYHNGRGLEYAMAVINSVDGIYREEFGLALQVSTVINVLNPNTDPFDYGNIRIETMLRNFRDYRMRSSTLNTSVSLVHLFTGNRPSDEPVGLAWIDTACRTDGYDVGLSTPYKQDILLAAHEIAHNLGALHDSETACASSTDKVMWPYISSATSQQFSNCTVETVKRAINKPGTCHAEAIDLELALSVDSDDTVKAIVRNNDEFRTNPAATLAIDLPSGGQARTVFGDCDDHSNQSDHIECTIGTLAPGADSTLVFQVDSSVTSELFASIEPSDFVDVSKHNNVAVVESNENELLVVSRGSTPNDQLLVLPEYDRPISLGASGTGSLSLISLLALMVIAAFRRHASALMCE